MPALDGMRILDLTQYEAGTSCTQALAWMGADVVKVEAPGAGDPGRHVAGSGAYFWNWNANKRSVVIDLRKPEGRAVLLELLPRFDVFVENYGPGVIERLDLEYETLRKVHPSIIYAQVKGYGSDGPYSKYLAYDMCAQAAAGTFSITGQPDGPPTLPGVTVGDSGTGMQLGMAILAAYVQKLRTGEGQRIEISMHEAITYYMRTHLANGGDWGRRAAPRNGSQVGAAPSGLYACKPCGRNDYAFVLAVTATHIDRLLMAIDRPDLIADPRFDTDAKRFARTPELHEEVEKWTRARTKQEVMRELGEAGVPCAATMDTAEVYDDPHLNARGFVKTVEHPELGTVRMLGFAPRLSANDVPFVRPPSLGEHTDSVLTAELGLDSQRLEALRAANVIG
ncbi:MAG: CoA transferase [Deltaproteobacteria bacterium]|nr:CoA transferase [Deltaproteobacteria bacterium]